MTAERRGIARLGGPRLSLSLLGFAALGCSAPPSGEPVELPTRTEQSSGTTALLQAISVVDSSTVWVSGHTGAILRTHTGGARWDPVPHPALDSLEFRDIHAFDSARAVVLSAGSGPLSRIYRTDDGGRSWRLGFLNAEPDGFYDCLDFWDDRRGVAYGDAVNGELRILRTEDGGNSWSLQRDGIPDPAGSEGGFAASGTCVATGSPGVAWIATGAGDRPRVLRTDDWGVTWTASEPPLPAGPSAGIFSLVRESDLEAIDGDFRITVFAGDLSRGDERTENVARSEDGGRSWGLATGTPYAGAVYGAAKVPGLPDALVAVGPGGVAISRDRAATWISVDSLSFWAAGFADARSGWVVGPRGRIVRLRFERRSN